MINLFLSIVASVLLLINFRFYPQFKVSTFQAIALNYIFCFITGLVLMPKGQHFNLDLHQNWTWMCLALGFGFILTFILSGISTQKNGMTITSMANNVSLVIPVLFSLFVFGSSSKVFDKYNYLGLVLALVAVATATFKPENNGQKSQNSVNGGLVALAVFLMYGITNTAINYLNIHYIPRPDLVVPVTLVMVLGAMISGIFLLIIRLVQGKERIEKQNIIGAITLGIPNFLSFYFLIKALSSFGNNGAFVYPIYNISVILLSSLVSIIFFKEKISLLNKIGLVIAIMAIVLISWQEIFVR